MGLSQAKQQVLACLKSGHYLNEDRVGIEGKNLFAVGLVSEEALIKVIQACTGLQYFEKPHDFIKGLNVHIMKIGGWYIKFYFMEPDCVFISVHR